MSSKNQENQISKSSPYASLQAVELEEAVLGAVLLDPGALAQVQGLPELAFSISAHRQIYQVMLGLRQRGLQPDLPTVACKLAELGILDEVQLY